MKPPVLLLLLLFWPLFGQQTQNVTVAASVPPAVQVNASYRGATGGRASIYYYVCANYVAGYVCQTQPAVAGNTPGISVLSGSNTVTVTWSNPPGAPQATGYDVMRFQSPVFANPCSSCSIAQGISGNSFVDSSPSLPAYNFPPSGLGKLQGATGQITLNNTGYQTPGLFWALGGYSYPFALIPRGAIPGNCLTVAAQPPFTSSVPCGGSGGLDQLTGDVLAGPGVGSQPATVVRIQGTAVYSTAPTLNQIFQFDGTAWGPQTFVGLSGAVSANCIVVGLTVSTVGCSSASDNGTTFTIAEPVQVGSTGAGFVQPGVTVVGSLPTCNSGATGTQGAVTDALAPTFLTTVTGGSSTFTPVVCNGTNWVAY
jgi:hypothetical protein